MLETTNSTEYENFTLYQDLLDFADDRGLFRIDPTHFLTAITSITVYYITRNCEAIHDDGSEYFAYLLSKFPEMVTECLVMAPDEDIRY